MKPHLFKIKLVIMKLLYVIIVLVLFALSTEATSSGEWVVVNLKDPVQAQKYNEALLSAWEELKRSSVQEMTIGKTKEAAYHTGLHRYRATVAAKSNGRDVEWLLVFSYENGKSKLLNAMELIH